MEKNKQEKYPYLRGGGELGRFIRNHDWTKTTVGPPEIWPQSIKTTVALILSSGLPMALWWDHADICFYNDDYNTTLGITGNDPVMELPSSADLYGPYRDAIKSKIEILKKSREGNFELIRKCRILI